MAILNIYQSLFLFFFYHPRENYAVIDFIRVRLPVVPVPVPTQYSSTLFLFDVTSPRNILRTSFISGRWLSGLRLSSTIVLSFAASSSPNSSRLIFWQQVTLIEWENCVIFLSKFSFYLFYYYYYYYYCCFCSFYFLFFFWGGGGGCGEWVAIQGWNTPPFSFLTLNQDFSWMWE